MDDKQKERAEQVALERQKELEANPPTHAQRMSIRGEEKGEHHTSSHGRSGVERRARSQFSNHTKDRFEKSDQVESMIMYGKAILY